MMEHTPVLLKEVLAMLSPRDWAVYFDGTFGGGGYTRAIMDAANCRVIACDRDSAVQPIADDFFVRYGERFRFVHSKFSRIKSILDEIGVKKLDGLVLDLGVSNFQLVDPTRGFSFRLNGPVDMRMGLCDASALEVIRKHSERDLANLIYELGEESFSRRIAKNIKLNLNKIENTWDLAEVIRASRRKIGKIDPATKTFQALRIFVNDELNELRRVMADSVELLNPNGKIVAVSFHSLEDRIVKLFFRQLVSGGNSAKFKLLNKKVLMSSPEEILLKPRARSAKLRGLAVLQ
jgi:16S rRNA (cytosine1402-N4)-methyltransferase